MHRYRRTDSAWADEYTTPIDAHAVGFASSHAEILPAFIRYDCVRDHTERIEPQATSATLHDPGEFGDDWDEPLRHDDVAAIDRYFAAISTLRGHVDAVTFRVGGVDHTVRTGSGSGREVRFETPRASLRSVIDWEIFDDLLIGNFTRTTLLGDWARNDLSRHFTPYVAKYADNGRAKTPAARRAYEVDYFRRAPLDMLRYRLSMRAQTALRSSARTLRARVKDGSITHRIGQRAYTATKR